MMAWTMIVVVEVVISSKFLGGRTQRIFLVNWIWGVKKREELMTSRFST